MLLIRLGMWLVVLAGTLALCAAALARGDQPL